MDSEEGSGTFQVSFGTLLKSTSVGEMWMDSDERLCFVIHFYSLLL